MIVYSAYSILLEQQGLIHVLCLVVFVIFVLKSLKIFYFSFFPKEMQQLKKKKDLRIFFDEFLTFDTCAKTLSEAVGRILGSIISKFKHLKM